MRGGGGGWGWGWSRGHFFDQHGQPCRSRDEEWDQEPWVHEKHGGVRGGVGQGGSMLGPALAAMQVEG